MKMLNNKKHRDETKVKPLEEIKSRPTLSIVVPSSVVDNAQSKELRSYLVGQIARTAATYKVDEIIIFHDRNKNQRDYCNFFVTNLQYLETPQYLRKPLFPLSEDLANSGLMNPLDSPHHLRIDEWCKYREGIVLRRPVKEGEGSWVNIGLTKDCKIDRQLQEKTRITVKLNENSFSDGKFYTGKVVSMNEPKKEGLYWGYMVRVAENFTELFDDSNFGEPYDFVIGTSDKGENYKYADYNKYKDYKHGLIVFGGLQGIEAMLESDETCSKSVDDLFNLYLNTCLDQGCRTIRTEEAMLISLAVLKPKLDDLN